MNIIEITNLEKKYEGETVLKNINLTVEQGEFICIHGKSGCGKSTLLNIIGLIEKFDSGSLKLFGKEIRNRSEFLKKNLIRYKIGYLFQNYALIDESTVKTNLLVGLKYTKYSESEKKKLIADALGKVGLSGFEDKCIYKLSGGEQQRVSIARALAKNPKIILGDEPTGALDSETGVIVLELLQKLCWEQDKTVILVTHNADIAKCADKVIRMKNGKVREIRINENPVPVREVEW